MKKTILFSIGFIVTCGWLASGVSWAEPAFPVPAKGGLPACMAELAICTGDLDSCDLAFDTCATDLSTCDTDLGTCSSDLNQTASELRQCESDLADCQATPEQAFPATGQTTCWDADWISYVEIECAGTGQDGDIQAGAELSYTDTGLTIIDNNTKLEWMKQDDNGGDCASYPGYLDKDCTFAWDEAFAFVAQLNTEPCFANACDWRVPNVKELQSIVNYENVRPAVSAEFNTVCVPSCTVETCSCTAWGYYRSSTSLANGPSFAWDVIFSDGSVFHDIKDFSEKSVRAVRGGLIE